MFSDPPLSKRQLGWLIVCAGATLGLVNLGADLAGAGRFAGFGPAQQQTLSAAVLLILLGLTLLPLGDRPA